MELPMQSLMPAFSAETEEMLIQQDGDLDHTSSQRFQLENENMSRELEEMVRGFGPVISVMKELRFELNRFIHQKDENRGEPGFRLLGTEPGISRLSQSLDLAYRRLETLAFGVASGESSLQVRIVAVNVSEQIEMYQAVVSDGVSKRDSYLVQGAIGLKSILSSALIKLEGARMDVTFEGD